jgi:hypothetical protein
MTAATFTQAIEALGFTDDAAAAAAMDCNERTVRRWRNAERPIPGPVATLVDLWGAIAGRVGLAESHKNALLPGRSRPAAGRHGGGRPRRSREPL